MSEQDQLYHQPNTFQEALHLFVRSPQTILVRHICSTLAKDPGYVLRNRRSIEIVVQSVLATQGIDASQALQGTSVFELIRLAGKKLGMRSTDERWTLYQG